MRAIRRYAVEYVEKVQSGIVAGMDEKLCCADMKTAIVSNFLVLSTHSDHDMALNELKKQAADWSFYDSSYVNELLEYLPQKERT